MPTSVDLVTLSDDLPVFLQGGVGAGYSAIDVRRSMRFMMQEGVLNAGDFKVTQRAAGAGMAVDVGAGNARVQGDSVSGEGDYYVRRNAALTGATEITADAAEANPRIDQVILEVKNDVHDGSGLNRGRVRYVKGTATAGATLDNRTGAAALPNTALRLADVLMPAGAVNVPTANIRDRRTWARGAHQRILRTTDAGGGTDYTSAASAGAAQAYEVIDSTNLSPRVETSGLGIIVVTLNGYHWHSGGAGLAEFELQVDGVGNAQRRFGPAGAGAAVFVWDLLIAGGSHVIRPVFRSVTAGQTANATVSAATQLVMIVEERLRPNADNS